MKRRIIHTDGPPGFGKSTLMEKIRRKHPDFTIIDTDAVDDAHALRLLENPKMIKSIENDDMLPVFRAKKK